MDLEDPKGANWDEIYLSKADFQTFLTSMKTAEDTGEILYYIDFETGTKAIWNVPVQ
jgi:hypothetical protein